MSEVLKTLGAAAGAMLAAAVVVQVVHVVVTRLARRSPVAAELARRAHRPALVFALLMALRESLRRTMAGGGWRDAVLHGLLLALIGVGAWLAGALLIVAEDAALSRFRTDVEDNAEARRVHTQVMVIRRITVVVVTVVAIGSMLLTFPGARTAGTSLLASAGIAGVVAAFAAQSLLGNVIAGMQIAFSSALRLDDVVVVEGEWGRVEEITLTYVVVHLWDDRRLTLPTSYFMSKPFQNWTRGRSELLGTVELDVDWTVPVAAMRDELRRVLGGTELWDGRVSVLQVTGAVGASVRLRALMSAADAATLWDLRCHVREELVAWLRDTHPDALPRVRAEVAGAGRRPTGTDGVGRGPAGTDGADDRVFGGSPDGRRRSTAFTGPDEPPPPVAAPPPPPT